jgi:predicted nucleotide-binding protein
MNVVGTIEQLIELGFKTGEDLARYHSWQVRTGAFLAQAFDRETAREFQEIASSLGDTKSSKMAQIGMLEGLAAKITDWERTAAQIAGPVSVIASTAGLSATPDSKRVFVVHGHDNAAKEMVARFLSRLSLDPIILHEQSSGGQTIVEKFERHSKVNFAVVLLTPDDVGGASADTLQTRARQNVVFELGFFVGRLGRGRVCALRKGSVEIPSDFQGVVYVDLDGAGAWRQSLAQELMDAGMKIDLNALVNK